MAAGGGAVIPIGVLCAARFRAVAGLAWIIALGDAGVARAEGAPTALRVVYRAAGDCPSETAYTSQVLARTTRVRLARRDDASFVSLLVTVSQAPAGFSGRLEVARDDGHVFARAVEGDTCEEVVSALALVTALTFDPQASASPSSGKLPPVVPAQPEPEASAPLPEPPRQPPPLAPATAPSPSEPRARWAEPSPSEATGWQVALGGQAALRRGVTPDPIVTLPLFVGVVLPLREPFAIGLRASFERSGTDLTDSASATAAFRWTAGALEGCPIAWSQGEVSASPCLRLEAGVVEAEGSGIVPARDDRRPWAAVGAVGRAEWAFLEPAFAELGAGVMVPLIRDRFFFQPDRTVHRPAAVGWLARIDLGLRFE
jgi:hypothetical protein